MCVLYSRADSRNLLGKFTKYTVCMLVGVGKRLHLPVSFTVFSMCKYIFFLIYSVEVFFLYTIRLGKNLLCGKKCFSPNGTKMEAAHKCSTV